MILIISQNQDPSTDNIISWLSYYRKPFRRINGEDYQNYSIDYSVKLTNNEHETQVEFGNFELEVFSSIFYRRWIPMNFKYSGLLNDLGYLDSVSLADIKRHIANELRKSYKPLFDKLSNKGVKMLPSFSSAFVDKLDVLKIAKLVGLKIPDTLITNNKTELLAFFTLHIDIINKPITEVLNFKGVNELYYMRTSMVSREDIDDLPERFFPSLFQKYIEKYVEIRCFFLEEEFFSMAIFSQADVQTKVDFRNYNDLDPNRTVPFKLPNYIEIMLKKLMAILQLNTGSIDMILTPENEFFFLEVNPVGQFDMTSIPCNYYLDKRIAKCL